MSRWEILGTDLHLLEEDFIWFLNRAERVYPTSQNKEGGGGFALWEEDFIPLSTS